jgi:pimeloyl-ACP methyl ester carboxylesterase
VPAETGEGLREGERAPEETARLEATVDSILADGLMPVDLRIISLQRLLDEHADLDETPPDAEASAEREDWIYRAANTLGRLYIAVGAAPRAFFYLEVAAEGMPDDADLLNTLGYLYADHGINLDRSEELIREALEVASEETPERVLGYYRDSLGWVLYRQGETESAIRELETADQMAPGTAEIRAHLIEVYEKLDRVEDATELLIEDLVAARGVNPVLRARLRRLNRTTPQGKPLPIEREIERRVLEREVAEVEEIEAAGGSVIRLTAADGFPLVATLYPSQEETGAPAALLLPMFGGERSDYDELARELAGAGITALSLDTRSHGASVTRDLYSPIVFRGDMPSYFRGALVDIAEAMRFLRESQVGEGQPMAVIGASVGGFLGSLASSGDESVKALVLLSPGTADAFIQAVGEHRERPTLLVASEGDPTAAAGAEAMIDLLDRTRSRVVIYPGASHGTDLLTGAEELTPLVVRWLKGAFKDARDL